MNSNFYILFGNMFIIHKFRNTVEKFKNKILKFELTSIIDIISIIIYIMFYVTNIKKKKNDLVLQSNIS